MNICFIGASGHSVYALQGIQGDESVNVTGIAPGSDGEKIEHFYGTLCKAGYPVRRFDSYIQMLDELKPDIAVVDCFFGDHARVGMEALKRGCHVFIEKPIATTLEDLDELRRVYKESGKHLAAMFGIRYHAPFLTAWEAVKNGAAGEIRLINAQKSYKLGHRGELYRKRELYGGTIPWVGSHAIDWVYWFSGEKFLSVYASHSRMHNNGHGDLEMTALCQFNLTNEVLASVTIDYLNPVQAPTHGDDRIRLVGTKGVLEVRGGCVFLTNDSAEGVQTLELLSEGNIFRDFLRQVRGEGDCLISAEDSFYVTEACIRARISADEKRIVVF